MSFYYEEVLRLNKSLHPHTDLSKRLIRSKAYMEKNYASGILLEDLSEEAALSRYHFIRLFKRFYGRTPLQYLQDIRIQKAKLLLQQGLTVTETSRAVGFKSLGSFSLLFRESTGRTPKTFLKKQFSRKNIADF